MKITVDTNVLVRAARLDDLAQVDLAHRILREATIVAIPLVVLCEFAWVMKSTYRLSKSQIHAAIAALVDAQNVVIDYDAVVAGLAFLAAGGDFADGVIAHDGRRLGGETFASFDRRALGLAASAGFKIHPKFAT